MYQAMLLFGPPGIGKGTQADRLANYSRLYHISTGNMFREIAKSGSELGNIVEDLIHTQGRLVPDDITMKAFAEYLETLQKRFVMPKTHVLLLDGIPRTIAQVEPLKAHADVRGIIYLFSGTDDETEREVLTARILQRAKVQNRADDTEGKLLGRLQEYRQKTLPVLELYPQSRIIKVDAFQAIPHVTKDITAALEELAVLPR